MSEEKTGGYCAICLNTTSGCDCSKKMFEAIEKEKSWASHCEDCGKYIGQRYRTGGKAKVPCNQKPKCEGMWVWKPFKR